jgi:hypothetical protein
MEKSVWKPWGLRLSGKSTSGTSAAQGRSKFFDFEKRKATKICSTQGYN